MVIVYSFSAVIPILTKSMSTSNITKSKKSSKDSEKKKFQSQPSTSDSNNINDKGPPTENDCKTYAGIGPDIIRNCAEQSMFETHLTEDVCNTLSEDINYKIRYIIHDALLKARLCGRDVITSRDIEETFSSLSIEKVYGAKTNPNWVPFSDLPSTSNSDQTFFYLDDSPINLIELAEEENTFVQHGDIVLSKQWYPDPDLTNPSSLHKNYFTVACQSVMSTDPELRQVVLRDISENPDVAPILQWFYNFGYLMLIKNIRYDSLTLRAGYFLLVKNISYDYLTLRSLELIETLENSPLSSANVSVQSLKLLVKLLLQRLLLSFSSSEMLNRICFTLSILCLRVPLRELAIEKINQKLESLSEEAILPILTTVYYLGIDGITEIFLPRITFFLDRISNESSMEIIYVTQAIYGLICKATLEDNYVYNWFDVTIPNELVIYWRSNYYQVKEFIEMDMHLNGQFLHNKIVQVEIDPTSLMGMKSYYIIINMHLILLESEKLEVNFLKMKSKLIKTRRKMKLVENTRLARCVLEQAFKLPSYDCRVRRKIQECRTNRQIYRKETHITVGKITLLLSVLKNVNGNNKVISKCCDHSLLSYNI